MAYFLALDCSLPSAEVSLLSKSKNSFKVLEKSNWIHKAFKSTHSDKLAQEIDRLFKKTKLSLRQLNGIAVGIGPGRFTGIRTAITTAKALSFSLKIPIYPVNTLKTLAEEFYEKKETVFVSLQGFKNQIFFGSFFSSKKEEILLLDFEKWKKRIKSLKQEKLICISDLEKFYPLDSELKNKVLFKEPKISSANLFKIVLREKPSAQTWFNLKACYLRSDF
ncbi:MAG: tRNA (adenosine(37)-N6)-threonylcarbamoyltransferase complex dimerization subunit type 1 TsaB [Bdellovibrionaceae bacterium]|nr:tRNA (adenosine(37)-N6)-threonylcarbamoyltransferase complex dimerization subunit type 1 TsaB [Pseudobdellovibrionaceae bacterium]